MELLQQDILTEGKSLSWYPKHFYSFQIDNTATFYIPRFDCIYCSNSQIKKVY